MNENDIFGDYNNGASVYSYSNAVDCLNFVETHELT